MIRWESLDPATVERAVKMLIRRLHPAAQGIDGSGGDAGQDVQWDAPGGLVIFEVKSYAARLSNNQKRKIKHSLTKAAGHRPVRWVLVLPLEPSPAEVMWFARLRSEFSEIALEWRGRDWLDEQFAGQPDLRRYVEGSDYDLLERARELSHEQAALANGATDLVARVNGLVHGRARELSPFWKVDISTEGIATTLRYSARVPDAATLDPVTFVPTFTFPADDPEADATMHQLTRAFDYGADATVDGRYIERVEIQASEQTRPLFGIDVTEADQLRLGAAENNEGLPLPIILTVTTAEGTALSSIGITLTRRTIGLRGIQLIGADPSGMLVVTHSIDHDVADGGRAGVFHFGFEEVSGRYPYAVRPVADFVLAMEQGSQVSAHLGHVRMGYADLDGDWPEGFGAIARFVVVLDEVQQHLGELFPIPPDLTLKDLRELEMVYELIVNGRARWPYRTIAANIRADRLADFLARDGMQHGQMGITVRTDAMRHTCGDRTLQLGPVQLWCPRMRLANLPELEAAVGTGSDPEARLVCMDDEHIYIRRLSNAQIDYSQG